MAQAPWQLVLNGSGGVIEREFNGPGADQVLASEAGPENDVGATTGTVNWLLADNQGSVRDVVRYNGTTTSKVNHLVYSTFGQLTGQDESDAFATPRNTFNGAYQDPKTELSKMGRRWYDARNAVFASYDPSGFRGGQTNLSEFVGNSPTNFIDPSGMYPDGYSDPTIRAPGGPIVGNGDGFECPCCTQAFGIRAGGLDLPEDYDAGGPFEGDGTGTVVVAGGFGGSGPGGHGGPSGPGGHGGPSSGGTPGDTGGGFGSWLSSLWDGYSNFIVNNVYGGEDQAAAFGQSVTDSGTSAQLTYVALEQNYIEGDANAASATLQKAYDLGPLGQTKNADPFIYYGTRGAFGVSVVAVSAAIIVDAASANCMSCFPAGTLVATPRGLFPIETLKAGEDVWAYDLVHSRWCPRPILKTFVTEHDGLSAKITLGDETIEATFLHPFWVVSGEDLGERPIRKHLARVPDGVTTAGRWVDAGDIRLGDELLLRDGRILPVNAVEHQPIRDKVYNLHVQDLQCYAVGQSSVLVHNSNGEQLEAELADRMQEVQAFEKLHSEAQAAGDFGTADGIWEGNIVPLQEEIAGIIGRIMGLGE